MKIRAAFLAGVLILGLALGYLGVSPVTEAEESESETDKELIGVFVTREYIDLYDFEAWFEDNWSPDMGSGELVIDNAQEYSRRLYAAMFTDENGHAGCEFEGVEGWCLMTPLLVDEHGEFYSSQSDPAFDVTENHIMETDAGTSRRLAATLYVVPAETVGPYFFNPVYQDAAGNVWLESGSSSSSTGNAGVSFTQTLSVDVTTTQNGVSESRGTEVAVTIEVKAPAELLRVLQYDAAGELVAAAEYRPETIPDSITPAAEADFVILESVSDGQTARELYGRDAETMSCFAKAENGILQRVSVRLEWDGEAEMNA